MNTKLVGLHMLLQPQLSGFSTFKENMHESILSAISDAAEKHKVNLIETAILPDHIHVLTTIDPTDSSTEVFIRDMVEELECALLKFDIIYEISDSVYITLLPPWHVDIMAAFLRDQVRYHRTHTLKQEINDIFNPQSWHEDEEAEEE